VFVESVSVRLDADPPPLLLLLLLLLLPPPPPPPPQAARAKDTIAGMAQVRRDQD
jgi:hypothetical protein